MVTTELRNLKYQGDEIGLDIFIIDFLGSNQQVSMKELGKYLEVIPSTTTKRADRLVRLGYIERTISNKDRRIVELHLTNKGRLLYDHFRQKRLIALKEIKRHFTEEELNSYINIIERRINLTKQFSFSDIQP